MNDNPYRSSILERPETFFSKPQLDNLAAQRKITQIIVGALMMGMVFFFIISAVAGGSLTNANLSFGLDKIITIIAVGYAVVAIVLSQVIAKFIYKKTSMAGDAPTDEEINKAHGQFQTELIIRSALLEGAGFFCLIALLIEHNYLALVGAAACVFFLLLKFPQESNHLYDVQRRLNDRV